MVNMQIISSYFYDKKSASNSSKNFAWKNRPSHANDKPVYVATMKEVKNTRSFMHNFRNSAFIANERIRCVTWKIVK